MTRGKAPYMGKKPYRSSKALGEVVEKWFHETSKDAEPLHVLHYKMRSDWGKLFGPQIGQYSRPVSLSFYKDKTTGGLLQIEADNPSIALILQTQEHNIINKITHYFGYKAVHSLRIKVKPMVTKRPKGAEYQSQVQQLNDVQSDSLYASLQGIKDEESRELMASIAMHIFAVK